MFHYDRLIAVDQAGKVVKKSHMEMVAAHQDLIIRVAKRYFAVLSAQDNLSFANISRWVLAQQRDKIHKQFDEGELTIIDITDIDAGFELAESDVIESKWQLQDAREGLRELTGHDFFSVIPLAKDIPLLAPEPKQEQPWLEQAMSQNPQILIARLISDIAHAEIKKQSAGHLPTLDVVGGNEYLQTGGQFGQYDALSSTIGIELNVPLYEGNQVNSRMREASFRHNEGKALLKQEQRKIYRQMRDAYNGIQAGISRIQSLKQTMGAQEASVKSILKGIEVGLRTNLDLVLSEKEWIRTRRDFARARIEYVLHTLRLKRAAGALTEEDLRWVNALLEH